MTRAGSGRESFLRTVLALVVVADLVSFFFFLSEARLIGIANGALNPFNDLLSRTAVRAAIVLIGIAGAVAFGRGPGRLGAGLVALGALALLSTAHAQLFGSPWRHLFFSGLCLSGWLLGLTVSRRRGMPTDESYARVGSLALLTAAYLNAGISKMVYGGIEWLSGLPIQATIVAQDGLVADSIFSPYRVWVVATPAAACLFSVATMGFELAAPLMLGSRRMRAGVALGLFAMHANIYILTSILYLESMVLLLAFGLCPEVASVEAANTAAEGRTGHRRFAAAAVVLALCAVLAVGHQARRFARSETARALTPGEPPPNVAPAPPEATAIPTTREATPTATTSPRREAGPFAVGTALADGWTVDTLDLSDSGFVMALSGRTGRAAFEVTCAASAHRSPFDLQAVHIFYSSNLPFRDLEPAGRAVQHGVQQGATDGNLCDRVATWRASLQSVLSP